jgi:hypothetical protein
MLLVVSVMGSSILGEVANASILRLDPLPRYTHALNWLLTSLQAPASAGYRVATLCYDRSRPFRETDRRLLDAQQMPAEECQDRDVEILVERRAIKAGSVDANPGSILHFSRRARR